MTDYVVNKELIKCSIMLMNTLIEEGNPVFMSKFSRKKGPVLGLGR